MASDWEIWAKQVSKPSVNAVPYAMPISIKEDPVVQRVIDKYKQRSRVGFIKYEVSMADNPKELKGWLIDLQEELMDATNYIERILQELKTKE